MMKNNEYKYVYNLKNEAGNVEEYIFIIEETKTKNY